MKKARVLRICLVGFVLLLGLLLFLGRDMYTAIWNAYEDKNHVSVRVNDTNDPKVLCVHSVETEEVTVQMEVLDITKDIEGLEHRYRLDVKLWNRDDTQYLYQVELIGFSKSLWTDQDRTEILYGNYYSSGEHRNKNTDTYWFIPNEKQKEEGLAGELSRRFYRNMPVPTTGTISVTVTTYLPYFDLKIHSFTQELTFPITEP